MKWLEPPEGREVNLEYCRFRLKEKEERYCYESTPLGDNDMRELLDVISYYSEERTKVISEEEIIEWEEVNSTDIFPLLAYHDTISKDE